jgi:hypothetical protein
VTNALLNEPIKNCCGVYLLNNFFANETPWTIEKWGRDEAERKRYYPTLIIDQAFVDKSNKLAGRETKEEYKTRIRTGLEHAINTLKNKKSYYLAILNELEAKEIEPILLDLGFEILVPLTKNPTGSAIVLYIYHLLPRHVVKKVVQSAIPRKRA